jgi:hypothetical protein
MKAQTSNRSATTICPENWQFQQQPLTSRDHYSWTLCQIRVCKYSLERYRSSLQLWCSIFLRNLYRLRLSDSYVMTAHSEQILSKRVKRNRNMCRLNLSPNLKRSWVILLFWPICSCRLVRELALTLPWHPTCFQPPTEIRAPCCFCIAINLVQLNQICRVRMRRKSEKVIHNSMIACFLRLYWLWGQKFRYLKMLNFVQNRISAARSTFKNS